MRGDNIEVCGVDIMVFCLCCVGDCVCVMFVVKYGVVVFGVCVVCNVCLWFDC